MKVIETLTIIRKYGPLLYPTPNNNEHGLHEFS